MDERSPHLADRRPRTVAPPAASRAGSIEAAFAEAGLGLSIADLRQAPRETAGPDRYRSQSAYLHTPVLDAFGGMFTVPASTVADLAS